jgi:hypothetical protein
MRIVVIAVAVLVIGCSGKSRCERGVHQVLTLTTHSDPKGSVPKADEQEVIDQIESMTISACEKEGLDQAQLDCILAMQTWRDLETLSKCPAIAAKRPTWVLAP